MAEVAAVVAVAAVAATVATTITTIITTTLRSNFTTTRWRIVWLKKLQQQQQQPRPDIPPREALFINIIIIIIPTPSITRPTCTNHICSTPNNKTILLRAALFLFLRLLHSIRNSNNNSNNFIRISTKET